MSRCHRLGKQCVPAPYTRKRGSRRQTRATQLEDKIEDLVTLLKTQTTETHPSSSSSPQSPPNPSTTQAKSGATHFPQGHPTPATSPPSLSSPEEEQTYLDLFRDVYLHYFPFVHIPHGTTVGEFKEGKPFLWSVVVGMTCRVTARREGILRGVEEVLARRVVVEHERDVDLLLGVVALLGWWVALLFSPSSSAYPPLLAFTCPRVFPHRHSTLKLIGTGSDTKGRASRTCGSSSTWP